LTLFGEIRAISTLLAYPLIVRFITLTLGVI